MTTRVHVVNFGNQPVEVLPNSDTSIGPAKVLYPHDSENFYVYGDSQLKIREIAVLPTQKA